MQKLTADEELSLPSGATFTAYAGWTIEERPELVIVTAPEGDATIAYVEVNAADRSAAIASAWKRWKPDFKLVPVNEQDYPVCEGWDAIGHIVYEAASVERRHVVALARRKGETWYVALIDGKEAGWGAELYFTIESLQFADE